MKKIEAIIDPSKMQEVKNALTKIGIRRMTISKVDEFGSQEAHKESFSDSVLLAVTPESSLIITKDAGG
jgi:nitrogen regulatory protein P-II 1